MIQIFASATTLLIGLGLFLLGILKEHRTKKRDKKMKDMDLLLYLSVVAKRLVELASRESKMLKDAGNKLVNSPFSIISLHFNFNADFQRGTNFRTADYLSAYRTQIGRENDNLQHFLTLTSYMEYAAKVYEDIVRVYGEKISDINKCRIEYRETFHSTVEQIDEMSCHPDIQHDQQFVEYLRNLTEGFFEIMNKGDDIYTKAYESAFSPIVNSFYIEPELRFGNTRSILLKVEIARSLLNDLENSSKVLGQILIDYAAEMHSIKNEIERANSTFSDRIL